MGATIEDKARENDWDSQRARAERLTGAAPSLLEQLDTFFKVPAGRLKLRKITPEQGELIFYQRPDQPGPKRSDYSVAITDRPEALRETLAQALGVWGEVIKRRWLYVSRSYGGLTRIHFDEVKGLGQHIELEVILQEGQQTEDGERIASEFRAALDIRDEDLIDCSYLDLITAHSGGGL